MSASTEFLSHPVEDGISLQNHLLKVARDAKSLVATTKYSADVAFYAGLLHDLGKLNPFYQKLFHAQKADRPALEKKLLEKYERQHSTFSAWAASYLLQKTLDQKTLDEHYFNLTLSIIAGHHSVLSKRISTDRSKDTSQNSQKEIIDAIPKFKSETLPAEGFNKLDWDACKTGFPRPISFQLEVQGRGDGVKSFLEACALFSAVLQADRGSFYEWSTPGYDLRLDTSKLVNKGSKLGTLRQHFQQKVLSEYNSDHDIAVIHAPTGIGKTKVFLDLISRHKKLERVIYFSPLLALTEDFETKIKLAAEKSLDDILIYNHLFSGILSQKSPEGYVQTDQGWNFENESFNHKFIVTTTQRLLLTLYSNTASDKLKLMSLKNSLLILDEIQVVPKFLLPNLIGMLGEICKMMNSKVLLVSATVPHEVKEAGVTIYGMSKEEYDEYHNRTKKKVEFQDGLSLPDVLTGRVLLMVNTRRKARRLFDKIRAKTEPHYLTGGVRKKDRAVMLEEIRKAKECVVVSTQVIEAGVDLSFSEVYREVAPLDNVVQVMGRLNREAETSLPLLHVFREDKDHRPYVELEYNTALRILQNVHNSEELYGCLEDYYRDISSSNLTNRKLTKKLLDLEEAMDFDGVWDLVRKSVFEEQEDPVLVPDSENDLEEVKAKLLSSERIDRRLFRGYANLVASLPRNVSFDKINDLFDPQLMERNILLPKRGKLSEVYDSKLGLDKWLT